GNLVSAFAGSVTVALGTNPSGGTLAGTTTVTAAGGVATFGTLSVDKVGTGYTLTATAPGLSGATSSAFTVTVGAATQFVFSVQPSATATGATSTPFDISPGQAAQLLFTVQPTGTTAGAVITPAVRVTARDAQGNTATGFNGSVTVALGANASGATLSGTPTAAAVGGVATFGDLSLDRAGSGYTLTAAATGVTTGSSAAFSITPGTAATLLFTVQPSNALAGAAITPAVQVVAHDAQGNTATGFSGNVTMALGANPGSGTLAG